MENFSSQRSSRPLVFYKKGILNIFEKFTENIFSGVFFLLKLQV